MDLLISDPTKAREELGWERNISFKELVEMMVEEDLNHLTKKHLEA